MKIRLLALAATLVLAGCSSPTVPDMTYFRLPPPAESVTEKSPVIALPIDVSVFGADGLYSEQALIYTPDQEGPALRSYHYQLWVDPPARLLQRRLIAVMRRAKVSPQVTDRLPASTDAVRISGLILSFDRTKSGENFVAKVALQLRVERSETVLSEKVYRAEVPAAGKDLTATVNAFGNAVDQIYAQFLTDLGSLNLAVPAKP